MSLFRVVWDHEVEADSPVEAAFLAYQKQKGESMATVSYSVSADQSSIVEDVTIAEIAPIALMTRRESQVAKYLVLGASNLDIAGQLGIKERTVKAYVSSMLVKFHVTNRVHLAAMLLRHPQGVQGV